MVRMQVRSSKAWLYWSWRPWHTVKAPWHTLRLAQTVYRLTVRMILAARGT